jgi:hypothetical protein
MGAILGGLMAPFGGGGGSGRATTSPSVDVFARPGTGDGFGSALGWDEEAAGDGEEGRGGTPEEAALALEMSGVGDWPSAALLRAPVAYRQALPEDVIEALRGE